MSVISVKQGEASFQPVYINIKSDSPAELRAFLDILNVGIVQNEASYSIISEELVGNLEAILEGK